MKFLKFVVFASFAVILASCGDFEWFPTDESPDSFSFSEKKDVEPGSTVTSDSVTIKGIDIDSDISIRNGEFSIDDGDFRSTRGKIKKNQTVRVRHVAADISGTSTTTYLTVGDVTVPFKSTTVDTIPDAFEFTSPEGPVPFGTYSSNAVTITGLTGPAKATFGGYGYYRVNDEANASTVREGSVVKIFHEVTSTDTNTGILTIGGVSGSYTTTGVAGESAARR